MTKVYLRAEDNEAGVTLEESIDKIHTTIDVRQLDWISLTDD